MHQPCLFARCGDGFIWAGRETCDDGNRIDTDACRNGCVPARCGDRAVWAGEECDDGDMDNDDACLMIVEILDAAMAMYVGLSNVMTATQLIQMSVPTNVLWLTVVMVQFFPG